MKGEEVVNEILSNPVLLQKIADKVYEKLREDVMIKRLDSLEELIKANIDEIKKLYEQQPKILDKLGEMSNKIDEHGKTLEDHKNKLENINKSLQDHTQRLANMQKSIKKLQHEIGTYTSRSSLSWKRL